MEAAKTYSIAGFKVRMTGGDILRAFDRIPGFREFAPDGYTASSAPDIELRMEGFTMADSPSGSAPLSAFATGEIVHDLSPVDEGWLYEMREAGDPAGAPLARIIYSSGAGKATMSGCENWLVLKFALWVAFSLFAASRKAIPVHASAVVREGSAVLFLGESGTGKSTHTRLWMQHLDNTWLLNDDSPFVRVRGDGIFAYGSPWSGKTHCYRSEHVPLKAMVRLRQGEQNRIERLTGPRAIGALWPSCPPLMAGEKELSALMLDTVGRLVAAVPVYGMECRPDEEAARVAYETIFNAR